MRILLGSGSPRRRQLLQEMDIKFEIAHLKDIYETYPSDLAPEKVPEYLSQLKAASYLDELSDDTILITADTVVIHKGKILGKPADKDEAVKMLIELAGDTHKVVTGVTLTSKNKSISFSETTEVEFMPIDKDHIEKYVDKYLPLDKAGSYGIQEWIGLTAVKGIRGCFYNVMGLPTAALYHQLIKF
ncbi:MAG: Maf family nucleotide pyrophosphatase [Muribaculaceae bacterium]|nr:Maf family nucleotide pyrophosphatase [Muribaculaceae bacterium]